MAELEHVVTWGSWKDNRGYSWTYAECEPCGWRGKVENTGYSGGSSLQQQNEVEQHIAGPVAADTLRPEPHEFTVEHSGRFARIVCTCSWAGDWNPDHIPTLSKRLHSDENAHRAEIRRTA